MNEIWLPLPDHPDYHVSNIGNVRSRKSGAWKPIKLHENKICGHYISFCISENGKVKRKLVHRIVLELHREKPPPDMECAHLNGNPKDNRIENLMWVTRKTNIGHNVARGTHSRGEKTYNAVLRPIDIIAIRELCKGKKISQNTIAKCFGTTQPVISNIHLREKMEAS